ncbi:GntR family transcriptional regulator [Paenibacillus arenilitoris]|uniref:GntR family transcriptional regulator n=1 Tax=Paenibacillus arenilitoris TaxID=2772299 RepID=A0A927CPS3_9BACL|nr:GntR family transcriptional regulator [Paenibacillus arenilitoris]MBD2871257.1 GntR family transcriptional regulator [Paenibacillus arenilitoris]
MKEQQTPKYMQLKQQILSWIVTAQFKPHDRLPSENELGRQFELSRQTVRQALGDLEQEGWLYRVQGKGTFVSDQSHTERRGPSQGMTIGMITTYISDYIFPTIVRGVESSLRAVGARLLLASTDNEKKKEKDSLESMLREPLTGLIIEPTKSAEGNPNFNYFMALDALKIPYIMLNERYSDVDAPCLRVDDELGGYRAAEHLIALGHSRIAGFFKTDDFQGVHRMRGFLRAHREHGLSVQADYLHRYASEEKQSKPAEALFALLQREPARRPTAIVCYNDELAVRMLDVIRQIGLAVPEDLSIVGFDDAVLAIATEVKLTTVAHPKTGMGADAVELLLGLVENRQRNRAQDIVYDPQLVIRESTQAPKQ